MWGNTVAIHSVLQKNVKFSTSSILKKKSTKTIVEKIIKKTKIIIKNKNKNKKINHVGKHCSNPQCFVRKAIVVFINQLNIKKNRQR
jgi:hypothetical protein